MTRKIFIGVSALALLLYAAGFVWHAQSARNQTSDAFLERQLWLARQSARFLEERQNQEGAGLQAAVQQLVIAEGQVAESHLALFDRRREAFVSLPATSPSLHERLNADAQLRGKLALGVHGNHRLTLADGAWLLTYLPLRAGAEELTLVLAAPQAPVFTPLQRFVRAQLAGHLALAALGAALGAWLWRRHEAARNGLAESRGDTGESLMELQNQCRALAQENALLGAARREYQLLVEGAEQGLARINSNGQLLFCSKPFLLVTGRERKEIIGRNLLDLELFDAAAREDLRKLLGSVRGGALVDPLACLLLHPQDGPRDVLVCVSPLRVEGEITGYLLQVQPQAVSASHLRASLS